jgi:hypothetical protein
MQSRGLALRDNALAALFGIIGAGSFGSEQQAQFGNDWAGDVGADMGFGFGDDYGFGAPAPAAHPGHPAAHHAAPGRPSAAQAMALWHKHATMQAHTAHREQLLEPNKYSTVKIERYRFPLNQTIVLGTAVALSLSSQPDVKIRPQRLTCNAPVPMFATLSEIKVANVAVTVGGGNSIDAYELNANGQGQEMDLPTIEPSNKATVVGNYNGLVPPGFLGGSSVVFVTSFTGPSSMAG